MRSADRPSRARIRDAAIELIAAEGTDAFTARAVAKRAGVSAGSVINNFGSMDGLRHACDEYVVALIKDQKSKAIAQGPSLDLATALREAELGHLIAYLAAVLTDDSPHLAHLIDELVNDATDYLEQGVASGIIRPSANPRDRAIVLMLWSLGGLVLNAHLKRLMGVDLAQNEVGPYAAAGFDIYRGLFTDDFIRSNLEGLGND